MAWNESGDEDNNEKDPWSGRDRKSSSKPKDLDDVMKQLQEKFTAFMGKKGKKSGNGKGKSAATKGGVFGIALLLIAVLIVWGVTGLFIVQPPERAVIVRFGKYSDTVGAGLHWLPRFIKNEYKVNIQKLYSYTYPPSDNALMLTKDQNIVAVAITVQFRVDNPKNYLFNVVSPVESLHQASASALRQVVGKMTLDDILTTKREELRNNVKIQLDATLARYKAGLNVVNVLLKSAKAPDAVQAAFDDAVKAQEDEKRFVNQAQAYAMKVEPIAKGRAKRIMASAQAYQKQVVLQAQGRIASFLALLPEYKKAPQVTRERLYLGAIENVLQHTSKVLINGTGTNNLLYLPLNKLINQTQPGSQTQSVAGSPQGTNGSVVTTAPQSQLFSTRTLRLGRDNVPVSDYGN